MLPFRYVSRLREGKLEELGQPSQPAQSPEDPESPPSKTKRISQGDNIQTIAIASSPPAAPTHQLDAIAPRELLLQIVSCFFDFVYPNIPCVHKPSFMLDLEERREESDPVFFAFVMSLIATTLAQTPGPCIPLEGDALRSLAKRCYETSRSIISVYYDPPTTMHTVLRYL
jgi:hypothetical protein